MNNIQQVLQQQCDYGEHEFTIASDGKNCIKCKLHVAEQTELEEIKDVIAEHILTKGNQVYISGEGEEKLKHILEQALTSYAEVRVKEERNRVYNYCLENVADKAGLLEINQLLDVIKGNDVEYKEWHTLLTNKEDNQLT